MDEVSRETSLFKNALKASTPSMGLSVGNFGFGQFCDGRQNVCTIKQHITFRACSNYFGIPDNTRNPVSSFIRKPFHATQFSGCSKTEVSGMCLPTTPEILPVIQGIRGRCRW